MFTAGYCRVGSPVVLTSEQLSPASIRLAQGAAMNSEYLPIWSDVSVKKIHDINAGDIRIMSGEALLGTDLRKDMLSYHLTVEAQTATILRIGTLYFPGWNAYDHGVLMSIEPENLTGLLTLRLAPGSHDLLIRFEDTPVRTVSQYISLVSVVVLCFLFVAQYRRTQYHKERV